MNTNPNAIVSRYRTINTRSGSLSLMMDKAAASQVVKLALEYLGRDLQAETNKTNDGRYNTEFCLVGDDDDERPITTPEWAVIEAFARYCRDYTPGLERQEKVLFPKAIHFNDTATNNFRRHHTGYQDESRAYQLCEVLECCFDVDCQVADTSNGWSVIVSKSGGIGAEEFTQMQGVARALMQYTVAPADDTVWRDGDDIDHSPEARRTWHERTNAQASRIELKLDALLTRLDAHVDPHRDTKAAKDAPAAVDAFAEDDNSDKHQRREPSRKSGKSSAKSK